MPGSRTTYLKAMGIVQWRLRTQEGFGAAAAAPMSAPAPTEGLSSASAGAARSDRSAGGKSGSSVGAVSAAGSVACPRSDPPSDEDISRFGWEALQRTVAACTRCELHRTRTQTVFGVGNHEAQWMFVGEAPGGEEDRLGEPFVGRAGKLLDAMLAAVGKARGEVFIANVLKCRPPNNRDPQGEEVRQCGAYLLRQIELVQPKLLIALGRFAAQSLLNTTRPISKLRGEVFQHAASDTPLVVTYHPAYLLRNPLDKRKAWQDLCLIRRISDST